MNTIKLKNNLLKIMSDKIGKAKSERTGLEYDLFRDDSPIFMCDILGFKNFIQESNLDESVQLMASIADAINYMNQHSNKITGFQVLKSYFFSWPGLLIFLKQFLWLFIIILLTTLVTTYRVKKILR